MLSKAVILYLQGQKQVSQSYERKLKCLIRKKMAVLQKELPLLSKLFGDGVNSFMDISTTTKLAAPSAKDKRSFNPSSQPLTPNNSATKFSNLQKNESIFENEKLVAREGVEGSMSSSNDHPSFNATKFSNIQTKCATKNNFDEKRRRERDLNPRGPHGPQAI